MSRGWPDAQEFITACLPRGAERGQKLELKFRPRVSYRCELPIARIVTRSLQHYWRFSRGLTLGAQGCVIDDQQRVLLIRHTYRPGWHFPGGGVEKNETVETALTRELQEETGVIVTGRPQLFGLYSHHAVFPSDHIALFVVRYWHQPSKPLNSREIAEQNFFSPGNLPDGIQPSTARRVHEIISGGPADPVW